MKNKGQIDSRQLQIQGLLDRYLKTDSVNKGFEGSTNHLDEDSLTAFVEGNLTERESKPIVTHLSDCSYCRHISAELIKLDFAFADEPMPIAQIEGEPTKVSEVLGGILTRIFGANDGAVFAHHEKEDKDEEDGTDKKSE